MDVLGFQPFVAWDYVEFDFFAFVQGFESGTQYGSMMHKNILSRVLCDKPKTLLVVEPFYFAAGHRRLSPDQSEARHQKKKTHPHKCAFKSLLGLHTPEFESTIEA
jgi:hypothetical protein